ncbi:MAG: rhodanese-like domain-containing protein [Myxococcales bacterium]|nr:rhodanese-like domain-containing protein [Myxococcales bacterium]
MKLVTPPEAQAALEADERTVYLDVRTVQEFAAGHAAGAINLPVMTRDPSGMMMPNRDFIAIAEKVLDKTQPVLCGCMSGGRSQAAAKMLLDHGFDDVTNILGGWGGGGDPRTGQRVSGWLASGLPTSTDVDDETSYEALRRKAGL